MRLYNANIFFERGPQHERRNYCIPRILRYPVFRRSDFLLQRQQQEPERLLPRRPLHGTVGHRNERSGVGYVGVAAHGSARLDPRFRLRPDLDRHRPCTRHCGQLDLLRKEAAQAVRCRKRRNHRSPVPDKPLCFAEKDPSGHLCDHIPHCLHRVCRLGAGRRHLCVREPVPQHLAEHRNAHLHAHHHRLHLPRRLQGRLLD